MKLILLGPPGAGKGTQAAVLKEHYNIPHISTGDIFRDNIKNGTELGKKAQSFIEKGELVPDSLVIDIALDRLEKDDCKAGFLLDGFPRTTEQAQALDEYLASKDDKLDAVLDIDVPKEVLVDRLTSRVVCRDCGATFNLKNLPPKKEGICDDCGGELYQRADDNAETVENRIDVYNGQTKPLIDYYEKAGNILHLDGTIGLENLTEAIVKALGA